MPTLTDLPDELVERLAPSGLFLVSKRIHAIALPSYYNKVTLDSGNIAAFVNTIIAKPALGMLVRDATVLHYYEGEFNLFSRFWRRYNERLQRKEPQPRYSVTFESRLAAAQAYIPDEPVVLAAQAVGNWLEIALQQPSTTQPALIYLLLWYLPNLCSFSLGTGLGDIFLQQAMNDQFGPRSANRRIPPALTNVQFVSLYNRAHMGQLHPLHALPLFVLPSLVEVKLDGTSTYITWGPADQATLASYAGTAKFSSLIVNDAGVALPVFAGLIKIFHPGTLKNLQWNINSPLQRALSGPAVMGIIAPAHDSLLSLAIRMPVLEFPLHEPLGPLLFRFRVLEELTLNCSFLVILGILAGNRQDENVLMVLPATLKKLQINNLEWRRVGERFVDQLIKMVVTYPSLETLAIQASPKPWPEALVSACASASVGVVMIDPSPTLGKCCVVNFRLIIYF